MPKSKVTDDVLMERAKTVCGILREHNGWFFSSDLAEAAGLTVGQLKAVVKFQRRWFLKHPEMCGTTYILSGARGYKLPKTDEDYVAMYKSLYAWGKSVLITISPIGKYLNGKGYDMATIRKEIMKSYGFETDSIGGSDSWIEEE